MNTEISQEQKDILMGLNLENFEYNGTDPVIKTVVDYDQSQEIQLPEVVPQKWDVMSHRCSGKKSCQL